MMGRPFIDTALVCENGHVATLHLSEHRRANNCNRCGAATMSKCRECGANIPGAYSNVIIAMEVAPPSYCENCGTPYPWRIQTLARADRFAEMQAETLKLNERDTAQLRGFVDDVVHRRVTEAETKTVFGWLKAKVGMPALRLFGAGVKDFATDEAVKWIEESVDALL